jgi:hypothetical protein
MGKGNLWVNATGCCGVWVWVGTCEPLQNLYPGYGYDGFRAKKGQPDSAPNLHAPILIGVTIIMIIQSKLQ